MTIEAERGKRTRKRLLLALAIVVAVLLLLVVPPYISISRYQSRITQLVSTSLGRPVRLSAVEMRLLPSPGFVITDLTVQEDPAYGAEPILHANAVVASIRLLSLWRGRLELSQISVDEASLNLVRSDSGQWNLDPFLRAATTRNAPRSEAPAFPYLEATNSRINVKKGIEKLPYSLVNADVSFWQEDAGDWRVRLRGQPARTDVSLDLADTGIVRLEGRLRRVSNLSQTPIHLELDWREAQLGQLSRLILGSDPGWRGDLTGQMQLDGTAEAAQVKTRLTATGVHRAEFAPPEALDFDANCNFVYHYVDRAVEKLSCDSPLGGGQIMLSGELPADHPASFSVVAQRIPVSAGLDALRTLRSGFNSDLEARGSVSGRITYDPGAMEAAPGNGPAARMSSPKKRNARASAPEVRSPLLGSLVVEGLRLSGGGLAQPLQVAKAVTLQPAAVGAGQSVSLTATIPIPAGGAAPLTVAVQLAASGYRATVRGQASLPRIRDLAHMAAMTDVSALEDLAGDPATLDLSAEGPWLPEARIASPAPALSPGDLDDALALRNADADQLAGTVTLHNANWKSAALVNHVEIAQAVLQLGGEAIVWDPIEFAYGPVKGTASFQPAPQTCPPGEECVPQLDLHFGQIDAAQLQAALLGAKRESTVISSLIDRFSSSSTPAWPRLNATVRADSLKLGQLAIEDATIAMQVQATGVEFTNFAGALLGGKFEGTGKLTQGDKPAYRFDGKIEKASPAAACRIFSLRCAGGSIDADGQVDLAGFSDRDLAASAKGTLHFEWRHGSFGDRSAESPGVPKAMTRFDRWTADVTIGGNGATIAASDVEQGSRKARVDATVIFADQPSIHFPQARSAESAKR
ncbi:MAG TPA: AsmA family protein [Terracidiphilus sp.]|nr:AsmA family protein [Terracidiphilus sp.]